MKIRRFAALAAVLAVAFAIVGLASATSNGDSDNGGIRTSKGLSVAAAGASGLDGDTDEAAGGDGVPAPAPAQRGFGGEGVPIAPDIYPYGPVAQDSLTGLTVQGYGSAEADADSAVLEFYFYRSYGVEPSPVPVPEPQPGSDTGGSQSRSAPPSGGDDVILPEKPIAQPADPITEAEVQPVIDALRNAGAANVEFVNPYGDPYSAAVRATVNNVSQVDAIVSAGQNAAANLGDIFLSYTNVSYTVSNCAALERAAMDAAVADAAERGDALAGALGVGRGPVLGASHYSYSPFGGSPCGGGFFDGPYPLGGITYTRGGPATVQVVANITVTYAIQ